MTATWQIARPEAHECTSTVNGWLRSNCAWTLADEYPQIFSNGARGARSVTIVESGETLAHAAYIDVPHRDASGHTLHVRLIGSVAVHPDQRGRGLGREVMQVITADFQSSNADLLLLWSDKPEFYAKFDILPWGREIAVETRAERPRNTVRPFRDADLDWLVETHNAKARRVVRTRADLALRLRIPRTQCWILEREGAAHAYACVGKGLDFEGVAHDSGGDDENLGELLRALPIRFALLPHNRIALARELGFVLEKPLGLGLLRSDVGTQAAEAARKINVEGLDSI